MTLKINEKDHHINDDNNDDDDNDDDGDLNKNYHKKEHCR